MLQRVLSAVALLPLVIVCVWWGFWPFALLVLFATVVGLNEIYTAFVHGGVRVNQPLGMALALLLFGAMLLKALTGVDLLAPALALVIMLGLAIWAPRHAEEGALVGWVATVTGALYIGGLLGFPLLLRTLDTPLQGGLLGALNPHSGVAWVFLALLATWSQDVLAYLVGRRWGRHKMAPRLSPKKTWEGAAGGMLGAIGGALLAVALFGLPLQLWATLLIGVIAGIVGPIGDLSESFIKRQVGLKDAGSLIPGHGGVLDRVDSLLFCAPAIYLLALLLV